METKVKTDLSVVLCGEAGQGIQTIEQALTYILKGAGYNSFATKEYMSRVRGGSNSTEIRIAKQKVFTFVNRIDILIPLSPGAVSHLSNRISADTLIIGQQNNPSLKSKILNADFAKIASDLGNKIYISSVAIGFVLGLFKIEAHWYEDYFSKLFGAKSKETVDQNISAAQQGYKFAADALSIMQISLDITPNAELKNEISLNGSEAIALGALAGNCNFISAYPMSPSTGVLTQLANYSHDFDIVVEQAEDEIAAINMALGAWYAGARAIVTTSGGGFALMCESMSLAGITETPVVIALGQRPGPATGLPTRTEQGDLNLAVYAGHGEFPRVLFAPGTFEQAFNLAQQAFHLADEFQVPVIILYDQYLADSYYSVKPMDPFIAANANAEFNIVKTAANYKRYQLTDNGISPRGIPGFGEGIVCVDSDEHTEEGYITEDFELREKMVQKRLKKLELLKNKAVAPEFFGANDYKTLIIGWGTNYHVVKEALAILNRKDVAFLHFSQVYPLHLESAKYFSKSKKNVVIENNATGQFAQLLRQQLKVNIDANILKYDGLPFSVEEVINKIMANL